MKNNKKGFSLLVAIGLVLITTLLAYTILEYMVPFGRNIKGVENSANAYYLANTGIERGLYFFSTREGNQIRNDTLKNYGAGLSSDFRLQTISRGTVVPPPGRGNSEYDTNWNRIGIGEPIQLSIGYGTISTSNINGLAISFRVPEINTGIRPNVNNSTSFINWQLTSINNTLNSISTTTFNGSNINTGNPIALRNRQGVLLNGTNQTFENFFISNNCANVNTECILKFSVINDLVSGTSTLPYLEWRFEFCNGLPILCSNNGILRYSIIDSQGKSSGFVRDLNIKVPQKTVSEAFDFTVFQ